MAALHDLQDNSRKRSQFLQIDYLLLLLSLCGFVFVFVCLLVVFISRKMKHQKSNQATDFDLASSKMFMEGFTVKNFDMKEDKELIKDSISEERKCFTKEDKEDLCLNNEEINETGQDTESKDMGDRFDNINLDDQYHNLNDGLFTLMYPQLALYNVFQSQKPMPVPSKPSICITEITSEDENSDKKDEDEKSDSTNSVEKCNSSIFKLNKTDQMSLTNKTTRVNPFNEEQNNSINHDDMTQTSNNRQDCEKVSFENGLNINTLSEEKNSEGTVDSEEDSESDTTSSSSSSESAESSDSSNLGKLAKAKPYSSKKKCFMNKVINDKLSNIEITSENMKEMDKQLLLIDNDIKSLPSLNHLEIVDFIMEKEIEEQMASRFESLQRDISIFLKKTVNIENPENLFSTTEPEDNRPSSSYNCQSPDRERNIFSNSETYIETGRPKVLRNIFLNSAGDNIHHDELIIDSSELSTYSWPHIDNDYNVLSGIQLTEFNSDSVNNHRDSLASLNDERTQDNENQNSNLTTVNLEQVSLPKLTKVDITDRRFPFHFPFQSNESEDRRFQFQSNESEDRRLPFLFPFQSNEYEEELEQSSSTMEITSQIHLQIDEQSNVEQSNDNNEHVTNLMCDLPLSQSYEYTKECNLGLDDSQSSNDIQSDSKCIQQTNKNAFTDTDDCLRVHHFRGKNVQKAVKLFENVVTDKTKFELKSPGKISQLTKTNKS